MRECPARRRLQRQANYKRTKRGREGMLILLILCGAVSCAGCALLLGLGRAKARRYGDSVPQRFHAGHVPRLGGVAMMMGCTVGWTWIAAANSGLVISSQIDLSLTEA